MPSASGWGRKKRDCSDMLPFLLSGPSFHAKRPLLRGFTFASFYKLFCRVGLTAHSVDNRANDGSPKAKQGGEHVYIWTVIRYAGLGIPFAVQQERGDTVCGAKKRAS
jgi:hypothetical protein